MSRATAIPERSRTIRARVRVLAAGGAAVGALLLTGCGSGQVTQTSSEVSAVTGDGAVTDGIAVRNAQIPFPGNALNGVAYPKGGTAPVSLTIVNSGAQGDRLVSASSPAGGSVVITGDTSVPPQLPLVSGGATGVTPPAGGSRTIGVQIIGLTQDIRPGLTYPLVLTFERAGTVTLDLPVGPPATARTVAPAPAEGR